MNKLALSILACGYLCRVYTDARRPVFMPLWNYAFNQGGPDPDYVYSTAEIDPNGVYRISGFRGTTRFVEITQQSFDMMSPDASWAAGDVAPRSRPPRPRRARPSTTTATSAWSSAPNDPPATRRLVGAGPRAPSACSCGKCSCDWTNEVDARVAINRLDDGGADMTPEEIARRFSDLAAVDRGHDRVRHGAGALLPRAPRREHVPALAEDRLDGRPAASRPTTTASTRSTTTRR